MRRHILGVALLAGAAAMTACGGGTGSEPQAFTAQAGRLSLRIGDAPVDGATRVVIIFTGVELQPLSGERVDIDFPAPREVDLLAYQDGATVNLLENQVVPAGDYEWMRLKVIAERNRSDGSFIEFTGPVQYPLYVPSGAETGLKLNRPFRVGAGTVTRLVADFDLRKSILRPRGQDPNYVLKPVLRLMDELTTSTLEGTVDFAALALAQLGEGATAGDCDAGVYVFTGGDATPDDADADLAGADDGGSDPLVYLPVTMDEGATTGDYRVAFLETGTYTVAATCDFDVDASPEENEYRPNALEGEAGYRTMHWTTVENVTIATEQTTTVNFPPPAP